MDASAMAAIIGLAQEELATAKANAERTSKLVYSYNAGAQEDLEKANNTATTHAESIKNREPENYTVATLWDIGAYMDANRITNCEKNMYNVEATGIMQNQYAADRVTAAEKNLRLLEKMMQFYETKLGELKQFYENLPAKQ